MQIDLYHKDDYMKATLFGNEHVAVYDDRNQIKEFMRMGCARQMYSEDLINALLEKGEYSKGNDKDQLKLEFPDY